MKYKFYETLLSQITVFKVKRAITDGLLPILDITDGVSLWVPHGSLNPIVIEFNFI